MFSVKPTTALHGPVAPGSRRRNAGIVSGLLSRSSVPSPTTGVIAIAGRSELSEMLVAPNT